MSRKPSVKGPKNPDPKIALISTSLITDPIAPSREDLTPEKVEGLARSIKQVGLIQPLVVRRVNGEYEVIAGHRRLLAVQVANLPLTPCVIIEAKGQEADFIKLHENLYREDLSPIDEGRYFAYLKETHDLTNDQIADKIGKSVGYVRDRVEILTYPPGLIEALRKKQIAFSVAKELVKIDDPMTLKDYTEHAVKSGVTGRVASQWARDFKIRKVYKRAKNPAADDAVKPPPTTKSALQCLACQGEVDIKFARIAYLHPDCAKSFEEAVKPPLIPADEEGNHGRRGGKPPPIARKNPVDSEEKPRRRREESGAD